MVSWHGYLTTLRGTAALVVTLALALQRLALADGPLSHADLEFFEKRIRPIFVEHCFECHGAGEVSGGLSLDDASGWLDGGDSGPAVVPGEPKESLLISAVRYGGELEMPPAGKLPAEKIQLFEQWVARGAPAPPGRPRNREPATIDFERAREFWAYQKVASPTSPEVSSNAVMCAEVDRFVLAGLDAVGLEPQPEAPPSVLVRRLYFDLIGLPPTPEEIDHCVNDWSPEAYTTLVDQLLASPQFGERWGRHWLDVVRFAESLTLRGFVLPEAWRYRDYVIESFGSDRPYDEFLKQQLAGDLLTADSVEARQRQLVATTFLALGNTNLEEQDKRQLDMDVVDEQLDVIGKAMLGQTISCARCHDHKFDPIPTRDYYALAGILRNVEVLEHANVSKWIEMPLPLPAEEDAYLKDEERAFTKLERQIAEARQQLAHLTGMQAGLPGPAVLVAADLPGIVVDDRQAKKVGHWMESQHSRRYIGEGYVHDMNQHKGEKTLSFVPELPRDGRYEVRLAYTPGNNRAQAVPVTVFSADGEQTIRVDMQRLPPLDGRWISLGEYRCEAAGQNFVLVANEHTRGHVIADAVQYLPVDNRSGKEVATASSSAEHPRKLAEFARLRGRLKLLEDEHRRRKADYERPMAITVRERNEISDSPIHVRGSVHTLGEVVPRGFLQLAGGSSTRLPADQSGRLELADWIASTDNPLTARVMANRVWHWLMGQGLVRTVDNFGTTGEAPSHPELLDHLAYRFMERGWSVKQLIRDIVLSATYRRSSQESDAGMRIDPENRLLWRANRKRLEAECLRDAMLLVAGQLDLSRGGPSLPAGIASDFDYVDRSTRRSVYVPVLRNSMPQLFEVFDFPDTSMVVGRRNCSTVAPQALFMINSPLVHKYSEAAARRMLAEEAVTGDSAITCAFRQTLGRAPLAAELQIARESLATADSPERGWTELYHMLFASLDFRYRD